MAGLLAIVAWQFRGRPPGGNRPMVLLLELAAVSALVFLTSPITRKQRLVGPLPDAYLLASRALTWDGMSRWMWAAAPYSPGFAWPFPRMGSDATARGSWTSASPAASPAGVTPVRPARWSGATARRPNSSPGGSSLAPCRVGGQALGMGERRQRPAAASRPEGSNTRKTPLGTPDHRTPLCVASGLTLTC